MNYRVKNHMIEVEDPNDGLFYPYCEEVGITRVITNLLEKTQMVEITLYAKPETVKFVIESDKLNRTVLPRLFKYGLTVIDNSTQTDFILEVLQSSKASATYEYVHDRLGFHVIDGRLVFLAHHPIGLTNPLKSSSTYTVPPKTAPSGTFDSWRDLVLNEMVGHPNMELILALSAVAPIAHLLREAGIISLVPMFALIGQTSTGKTLSLKIIASVYGVPSERGFIKDLNATQNAFAEQLGSDYALPALLDETSSVPEWDFTKSLYNLPTGRGKLRCKGDGTLNDPVQFSGTLIFTGERSLFEQAGTNAGLSARLIEFTQRWTDDADHSKRLEQGLKTCHGTAVYPLIEYILKHMDELPDLHAAEYRNLQTLVPNAANVEDRLFKTYAIILVAAQIASAAWDVPINIDAMRELLLQIHRENSRIHKDPAVIFEKIKRQILNNFAYFPTKDAKNATKIWGRQDFYESKDAIWIDAEIYEGFLENASIDDVEEINRIFYERGWLYRSEDRHYRFYRKLGNVRRLCYCLFVNVASPLQCVVKNGSQIDRLLEESGDEQ